MTEDATRDATSDPTMEITNDPVRLVGQIANHAMDAAHALAERDGAQILRIFVVLNMPGVDGQVEEACCASGSEISPDTRIAQKQLLLLLLENTRVIGNALGYDVQLVPRVGGT